MMGEPLAGHYELVDIRTFLAVAESGSISGAARRLELAKSMVSQRVARLEAALGAELLIRSNRGVKLTERGVHYLAQASEALVSLDAAAETLLADTTKISGTVRLSVPTSFANCFLSSVLLGFLKEHPGIVMQVELHDHRVDLAGEGYDLGVRITGERVEESDAWSAIGLSRRVVCCSPGYLKANGAPKSRRELSDHVGIGYTNLEPEHLWRFAGAPPSPERSLPAEGRLSTNSGDMMRDAAVAGFGITVLPLFIVADDLRAGRLVRIFPDHQPRPDRIVLGCAPRRSRLLRVRLLLEHIEGALGGVPPWERELPPALEF